MGLIDFLRNNPIGKKIEKGLENYTTFFQKPIASIKAVLGIGNQTFEQVKNTALNRSVGVQTFDIVKNTALTAVGITGVGTALETAGVIASRGAVASAVDTGLYQVVKHPFISIGSFLGIKTVANSQTLQNNIPKLANESIKELSNSPQDLGTLIDNPSIDNIEKFIKNNPIIFAGLSYLAISKLLGGFGLASNTIATWLNSKATKNNTGSGGENSANKGANSDNPIASSNNPQGSNVIINNYLQNPVVEGKKPATKKKTTKKKPATKKKTKKKTIKRRKSKK